MRRIKGRPEAMNFKEWHEMSQVTEGCKILQVCAEAKGILGEYRKVAGGKLQSLESETLDHK